MSKAERPTDVLERIAYSLEMIETYLGLLTPKLAQGGVNITDPPKVKPGPKSKAEKPKPEPEQQPDLLAVTSAIPTAENVRDALRAYMAVNGKDEAQALLKKFDAENVGEVPVDKRSEFIGLASVS